MNAAAVHLVLATYVVMLIWSAMDRKRKREKETAVLELQSGVLPAGILHVSEHSLTV